MKAEETVMNEEDLKNIVMIQALAKHNQGFLKYYDMDDGVESGKTIAEAQAEITWDIAIREVVEWIDKNKECVEESVSTRRGDKITARCFVVELYEPDWQAKLKEWGL